MNIIQPVEYIEITTQAVICIIYCIFIDYIISPKLKMTEIKWIFLHIWINLVVVIFSAYDVFICLTDFDRCFTDKWSTSAPFMMGVTSHLYHLATYKNIKYGDYVHHVPMAIICPLFAWPYLQNRCVNFALFALTGLPGGIDYVLLTLAKKGLIDPMIEKKANVYIHVWLRNAFLQIAVGMFIVALQTGKADFKTLIVAILTFWNGHYYMHDTLKNYYSKHYIEKPKKVVNDDDFAFSSDN